MAEKCPALQLEIHPQRGLLHIAKTCARTEHKDSVHIDGRTFPVEAWAKKTS